MWLNHLVSFEQKRSRKNDLMLGFYHSSGRGVKVFVDHPVRIPTRFIHIGSGKLDETIAKIRNDEFLKGFALDLHCATNVNQAPYSEQGISIWPGIKNFHVLAITMPNDKTLEGRLDKLVPQTFQFGNYDAMLKLRGFHPCRKVVFDEKMEEALVMINEYGGKRAKEIENLLNGLDERNKFKQSSENKRYEARLASLSGIKFLDEFLTRDEFEGRTHLYLDTEQPLYQSNEQQALVARHKKLVRTLKKHEKAPIEKRDEEHWHKTLELCSQIDELEARLVEKCPGFDDFYLWSEEFAPRITSICAIWENVNLKRLYWWDPHGEFKRDNVKGFDVINEQDNKRMLQRFRDDARGICAFDMTAHNASYDNRTLRQMMVEYGDMFDPGLEGVQIKRDLILGDLFQRLSERAVVHLDTLWLARTFFPWLNQRSLGTSFKLEGVAKQCRVNFKKSMSHEELRRAEIDRLFNPFGGLRAKASDDISYYAVNDLPPLPEIIKAMDARRFLCLMKDILPYCTYSEIVFSPNCARKSHTHRHLVNSGNLPHEGFQNVWRMDELWEFKKEFPKLKKQMLEYIGLEIPSKVKGEHRNVKEIYLPLEEWTREMLFRINPRFKIG